jgi:transcriptional regulator with XRE-family HTH domain
MKRLKELRVVQGLTQAELAKRIGTTQQSIARWEAGTSTPTIHSLDILAYALKTTISHLLGQRGLARGPEADNEEDGEKGVFWGHLGLLLRGTSKSKWYPIADQTYRRLWSAMRNLEIDDDQNYWLVCETLNNRMLAFKPDAIERIWLLDDACDGPTGDWSSKFVLDDYSGLSPAIYKAMDEWVDGAWGIEEESDEEKDRRKIVEALVKRAKLDDPDKLHAFLHNTELHLESGRVIEVWMEPDDLWSSLSDLEFGLNRAFYAPAFGGTHESFIPTRGLVLVDAPLMDVLEGRTDELRLR